MLFRLNKQKYARKQPKKKRRKSLQIVLSTNKGYIQETIKKVQTETKFRHKQLFSRRKNQTFIGKIHFLSKIARGHSIAAIVLTIQCRRKSSNCPYMNCCCKHVYHWTTIDEIVINWFFYVNKTKICSLNCRYFNVPGYFYPDKCLGRNHLAPASTLSSSDGFPNQEKRKSV